MRSKKTPYYKKRYKRQKKRFYNKRWFWNLVLVFLFSFSLSWLLFKTPYFQIKELRIVGENKLSNSIQSIIEQNSNFFLLNSTRLSQGIQKLFPKIGEIRIQKKFPNTIIISVKEKKPIGIICSSQKVDNCFLFAHDGIVFEKAKGKEDLPEFLISSKRKIKIGDLIIEERILGSFVFLQKELERIKILIKKVEVLPYELTITTKNGFKIYFSKDENLNAQIEVLISAFRSAISREEQKNLKYIDLRGIEQDGKGEIYFK